MEKFQTNLHKFVFNNNSTCIYGFGVMIIIDEPIFFVEKTKLKIKREK